MTGKQVDFLGEIDCATPNLGNCGDHPHSELGEIIMGDALSVLSQQPSSKFQCCVTSPPYWGLRDYDTVGQIGAEEKIDDYVESLTLVLREVRRVLAEDGILWLNIGDSYTSGGRTWRQSDRKNAARGMKYRPDTPEGLKPKDLIGVPWRVAFALQADGWYLRSDIVWNKPNSQPESVKDRPSRCHEYIFMLSKSEKYYYNYQAMREHLPNGRTRSTRSVWTINTEPFPGAHFAVFPSELARTCILASCKPKSTVLDPFFGSGTVGKVCQSMGLDFLGIELNPDYASLASDRLGLNTGVRRF